MTITAASMSTKDVFKAMEESGFFKGKPANVDVDFKIGSGAQYKDSEMDAQLLSIIILGSSADSSLHGAAKKMAQKFGANELKVLLKEAADGRGGRIELSKGEQNALSFMKKACQAHGNTKIMLNVQGQEIQFDPTPKMKETYTKALNIYYGYVGAQAANPGGKYQDAFQKKIDAL